MGSQGNPNNGALNCKQDLYLNDLILA